MTTPQFELSEGAAEVEVPPVVEVPEVEIQPEPEAAPAESLEPDTAEFEAVTAEPEATEEPVARRARARVALPARADPVVRAHAPPGRHGAGHARPAPFWERGDQPTQPLRPALGFPEPELVFP